MACSARGRIRDGKADVAYPKSSVKHHATELSRD
jgi:hypothetical protein